MPGNANDTRLHLVHVFPSFAVGGSQRRFAQFVAGVPDRYRHTVITLDGTSDMAQLLPESSAVHLLQPQIVKRSGPAAWSACRKWLGRLKPDCLVTYNWGSMDWCIANRLAPFSPHVHIEDGFGPEERASQLRRRVLTRRLVFSHGSSQVVVPSRSLERLAREVWKIPAARLKYIPNGVDCGRFGTAPGSAKPRPLTIGTVATLRREKNLERMIRAFCALAEDPAFPERDMELVIVGDGPERGKLEALAHASGAGARIRFAGASAAPERELAGLDIFALSSDTEQMPLSVLEAMASGLPIVSFAVGDVPEMVSPQNKLYASIPLNDEAGYRRTLRELVASQSLRRRLGDSNRVCATKRFDQSLMLERYTQLFGGGSAPVFQDGAE